MLFWICYLLTLMIFFGRFEWGGIFHKYDKDRVERFRFVMGISTLLIMTSVRYDIGFDWSNYNSIVHSYMAGYIDYRDAIPSLLFWCAAKLEMPELIYAMLAVCTYPAIIITLKKYATSFYESFMLYMCMFYLVSLSTMRQAAAVAVLFWGYRFIKQKKILPYLLTCIVAALFHKYALVGCVFILLFYLPEKLFFGLWMGGSAVGYLLRMFIVNNEQLKNTTLGWYLGDYANAGGSFISIANILIGAYCFFLLLWQGRTDRVWSVETRGLSKICLVGVSLPFILGSHTGGRVAEYFLIYLILLIPKGHEGFSMKVRKGMMVPFYLYFFAYLWVTAYVGKSTCYVPFKMYWS